MKSFAAHAVRHLVRAQAQLMGVSIDLSNQIRSGLKIFGLVAGKGEGRAPAFRVRELLDGAPRSPPSSTHCSWLGGSCASRLRCSTGG
jgi:transposase